MEKLLITLDEACEMLGVCRNTVYMMARKGEIPTVKVGPKKGGWRIPIRELEEWLHNEALKPKAA